jgi:hypothetical protein
MGKLRVGTRNVLAVGSLERGTYRASVSPVGPDWISLLKTAPPVRHRRVPRSGAKEWKAAYSSGLAA